MKVRLEDIQLESQNLDHLGLVAGICDEIGLVDIIDRACGQQAKNRHLTYGQCVKAMILNVYLDKAREGFKSYLETALYIHLI
jgi:hypothetical protein